MVDSENYLKNCCPLVWQLSFFKKRPEQEGSVQEHERISYAAA